MPEQFLIIPDSRTPREHSDLDHTRSEATDSEVGPWADLPPSTEASSGSKSTQTELAAAPVNSYNSQHQSPVPSKVGSIDDNQSISDRSREIPDEAQSPPPIGPTDSQIVQRYKDLRTGKQNCDLYDWGFSDDSEEDKHEIIQGEKDYVEKRDVKPAEKWTFYWIHYTFQHLCRKYKCSRDIQNRQAFATRVYSILRAHCDNETPVTSN